MQAIKQQNLDFLWQKSSNVDQMPYAIVRIGSALSDDYSGEGDSFLLITKTQVVRCVVNGSADDFRLVPNRIEQVDVNEVFVNRTVRGMNCNYVVANESCNGSVGKVYWSIDGYLNDTDEGKELHTWVPTRCCSDMPYLALKSRARKMAAQAKPTATE